MKPFAISIDIGGTFTDFVLLDRVANRLVTAKVLSTPQVPEEAIFQGFDQLAARARFDLSRCDVVLHATTLITNAVIERRGYDFILLHTEGFGTVLETGREHRYNLTDLRLRFPRPISSHALKVPVRERVGAGGDVLLAPNRDGVLAQVGSLVEETEIRNFAVCFLHAFRNGANEAIVAQWLAEAFPGASISTSSTVAPRQREYERWMTCAVNAYTKPLVAEYARRLEQGVASRGFSGRVLLMTSSGLPLPLERSVAFPVRLIESGPAAGVLAVRAIAARNAPEAGDGRALETVLAYDMGGTTAKGAFLIGNRVDVRSGLEVAREGAFEAGSGLPLFIPAIDLIEIGAGGGSIAHIDERGSLAVGPRSAGADPGPACYARGGREPTVTDANLVLGYLAAENFARSGIDADPEASREAIGRAIARPLDISLERAALGIHWTVNEDVARAFRVHAAELGLDYRRATLVCTGGSAPLQAAAIARLLHIRRVVFPFAAGVASAFGQFASQEGIVLQRSRLLRHAELRDGDIAREAADLLATDAYAVDLVEKGASWIVKLGLRYDGQDSEVTVEVGGQEEILAPDAVRERFAQAYERLFGLTFPSYETEIATWIVEVAHPFRIVSLEGATYDALSASASPEKPPRSCWLGTAAGEDRVPVRVFDRYALPRGWRIEGPALIEENDTTILIPAGTSARVAPTLDIIAEVSL